MGFEQFGLTIAGLVVGFMVGATGVGGGSLMTPILILGFGVKPALAVGTDLLYACATKSFGVWLHRTRGTVNWRIVGLLALGSLPACLITLYAMQQMGESGLKFSLITTTLAVMIIITGGFTVFKALIKKAAAHEEEPVIHWLHGRAREPLVVVLGALVGVTVTLSSVGAGAIVATLLLLLYPLLPTVAIVGTDIAYAIPLTLVAGLGHAGSGNVDWTMLAFMLAGSLPGIWLGTRFGFKVPEKVLRTTLGSMLVLIGVVLLFK
ncbi:MAG: sulfite exporter TauE/SafE family protein [Pseudomonadota bacterium]